jgi:predicted Zn-dependent protease
MRKILPSIVIVLFLTASLTAQVHHFEPGFNLFSKDQDIQLGKENADQVRKQMKVINDPVLTDYVNRVGKRLAAAPEAQQSGFPFTFEVVADPSINAFALPGGPMFINTGLLKAVDNEAQLAGVMGHEMSHVILRHGTNQATKAEFIRLPAILAQAGGGSSLTARMAQGGIALLSTGVLLKFSRSAESQADLTGSHLMAEAGYDPREMARFFDKLNAQGGRSLQFLSDHPNPANREKAIQAEAQAMPQQKYGYQTGDFAKMKKVVSEIHEPPPPKPQQ